MRRVPLLVVSLLLGASLAWAQQQPPPQPQPQPKPQPQPQPQPAQPPNFVVRKGRVERGDMVTVFYHIGGGQGTAGAPNTPPPPGRAALLQPILAKFLTPGVGTIEVSEPLHLLSITDKKDNIALLESVLTSLDVPEDQVLIEASIIEKTIDSDFQIGVEAAYSAPHSWLRSYGEIFDPNDFLASLNPGTAASGRFQGSTFRFKTTANGQRTLDLRLRALLQRGQARILSKPSVLVLNGNVARITSGQRVPVPTVSFVNNSFQVTVAYQDVNIELNVKPYIIGEEFVDLNINPKVGAVIGEEEIQGVLVPQISNREVQTDVVARGDGEPVYIGGLVREEEIVETRGLPGLMDVPLLKYVFSRQEKSLKKTEIVFILKPYIVKNAGEYNPRLVEPGK